MNILYHPIYTEHDTGMHPENKKRIEVFKGLEETEPLDGEPFLELVHSRSYIDQLRKACLENDRIDQDTVVVPGSFVAAKYAVGATIQASEQEGFALVRPPGHHAYPDRASGFCLFNNIAIATQRLVNQGKKVLIMDFDGHLGDGTSDIFYESDQVMYWSMHQYPAFPGNGFIDETGRGAGAGYTINVPLPPGSGDDIFLDAFESILPIAHQFKPDVVAVSAGFDAHQYDLLLNLKVSTYAFYELGRRLRKEFEQVFATLEGGYNVQELRKSVLTFVAGFNGEEPYIPLEEQTISGLRVWETYEMQLHAALAKLEKYWKK